MSKRFKKVYVVAEYGHDISVYDPDGHERLSKNRDDNDDRRFVELPGTDVGWKKVKWGGSILGPFYVELNGDDDK